MQYTDAEKDALIFGAIRKLTALGGPKPTTEQITRCIKEMEPEERARIIRLDKEREARDLMENARNKKGKK